MQKLGEFLARAGVQGADKNTKTRDELLKELRGMSAIQTFGPPHSHRAMEQLPPEFQVLRTCDKGEEFLKQCVVLIQAHQQLVTKMLIHGICQVAHSLRDSKQGSKRKSFERVLPKLLQLKNKLEKKEDRHAVLSSVLNATAQWLDN